MGQLEEKVGGSETAAAVAGGSPQAFETLPLTSLEAAGNRASEYPAYTVPATGNRIQVREMPIDYKGGAALKVAYAQVRTEPGFLAESASAHIATIQAAFERGCNLVQFPELSLTNYCCHDLFHDRTFLKAQQAWLEEVMKATKETPGMTVVVGFVDVDWSKERPANLPWNYNALAVIRDGERIETIHKKLLPNYDIFDEKRWFESGTGTKVVDINGVKVGFAICEDIWTQGYSVDPVKDLLAAGAEFISHSAASPIHVKKNNTRAELAQGITDRYNVPFGSVNMIGCYDGYEGDVPFDGRGLVRSKDGNWLAMGTPFKEELLIVDPFNSPASKIQDLSPVQELYFSAVTSIQDYFKRLEMVTGVKFNAVFGNSGGIDSGVIAALVTDALGPNRVYGLSLPTSYNLKETKDDARILSEHLGIHFKELPIQSFYQAGLECLSEEVKNDPTSDRRVSQNLQAALRTVAIRAHTMLHNGVMINTSNKTERFTNNFTIYADSAGNIGPIADFDKDRVYEVARFINKLHGKEVIPQTMIAREASAELDFNQVDATVMGDKPEKVAPHIRAIIERGANDADTARSILPEEAHGLVNRWMGSVKSSEWKGRQLPPGTRVTPKAHGFGRRIPINHGWKGQFPKAA